MASKLKHFFIFEKAIFFTILSLLSFFWLGAGPSNQELLANYAKAKDLADLIWAQKGFAWWSPHYLGGSPTVIQCGSALVHIWLLVGSAMFGPIVGGKIVGAVFLGIAGLMMAVFLRRLTGDNRAAWVGAFFFALGPQAALRLAGSEHMPAVFCMPYPPLIGWALLEMAQRGSGRGSILLGVGLAAMSLTYNKLALVFLPVVLGVGAWLYLKYPRSRVSFRSGTAVATGVWILLGIFPQLPGLRETGWMTLFSRDPLAGWQASFSMKAPISWINRDGFLFQGMPPNFTVEEGGFYLGLTALFAVAAVLWRRQEAIDSQLVGAFRVFAALFLFMCWLSFGPRSLVGGVQEFLKSAQGVPDWVLPLFWLSTVLPIVLLAAIWPVGRWKWPSWGLGLLILLLVPGFQLAAMLPMVGTIRGPWTFWQVGGVFCLAALAGIAVAILAKERRWAWISWATVVLAAVDFSPYYLRFFQTKLEGGTYEAYQETARFLHSQTKQGAILPLSGRYFYLQLPQLTGRAISTEAFQGYFMSKGMRSLQDGGGASAELMKTSLSVQGVRYIFIDRKDVDTPEQLQAAFRQQYPVVYENEFFTVLENSSSLAPGFLARNYVSIPKDSYDFSAADLGLIRLYFLPVELTGVEINDPGLAGIMKPQSGEVELTPAFRDRQGEPFRILDASIIRWEGSDRIRIQLSGEPFWVTLTQAWHPDWKVKIDGQPQEVIRVALALLGFRAPAGSGEAILIFDPPFWFPAVLSLGLLGWVSVLGGFAYFRFGFSPPSWEKWWEGGELAVEERQEKAVPRRREEKAPGDFSKIQKSLVVLPIHNKAETVLLVLHEVQAKAPGAEILVVDLGSSDGTAGIVKKTPNFGKKIYLLESSPGSNLGLVFRDSFHWTLKRGYDAVVALDAGLSYDPADIPKLLQALVEGADIAIGSRYLNGARVLNWPQSRLWMSLCAAMGMRMFSGLPITDPASGFYAIRRRVLEAMDLDLLTTQGYGFQTEIYFCAWQGGSRLQEVPIVFTERRGEHPKISWQIAGGTVWRVIQLAIRRVFP